MTSVRQGLRRVGCLLAGGLLMLCGGSAAAGESPSAPAANEQAPQAAASARDKALVFPFRGVIIPDSRIVKALVSGQETITDVQVAAALDKAEREGARLVVLEIDSPGGVVSTVNTISARILECPIETVALVTNSAISGAAITATACDQIVMVEGSTIGDAEPHLVNQKMPEHLREKTESPLRARVRANAEANGYPPKLLEAMITKSIALWRVTYADKEAEFLQQSELDLIEKQIASGEIERTITDRRIICEAGELLTLTHGEAHEYGLAGAVAATTEAFYQQRGLAPTDLLRYEPEPGAETRQWLSSTWMMVLVLCIVLGVSGTVVEATTPGFGVGGVVGLIGFACFFSILVLHGRAESWEVALFLVGLVLILVEIFLIPGFGVAGIGGLLCIGASFFFGYLPPLGSDSIRYDFGEQVAGMFQVLGGAAVLSILAGWFLTKHFGTVPVVKRIVHGAQLRSGADLWEEVSERDEAAYPHELEDEARRAHLVGTEGVSTTDLRPGGKIRIGTGELLDVVSDGGLIPIETRVQVVDVNGPRITVTRAE